MLAKTLTKMAKHLVFLGLFLVLPARQRWQIG